MNAISDKDIEFIEDFNSGSLNDDDKKKFKERLLTDSDFSKEYYFRMRIEKYWNEEDAYQITKTQVTNFFQTKRRNRRIMITMLSAASIIILCGISILFVPNFIPWGSKGSLSSTHKDSTSNLMTPQIDKQTEKGHLYALSPVYIANDTLFIQKQKDFPRTGELSLIGVHDKNQVFRMNFQSDINLISIPLQNIKSGEYQWLIVGTTISGNIIIDSKTNLKN